MSIAPPWKGIRCRPIGRGGYWGARVTVLLGCCKALFAGINISQGVAQAVFRFITGTPYSSKIHPKGGRWENEIKKL